MKACFSALLLLCTLLSACSDESDRPLQNYEQGLVEALSRGDKTISQIVLDNGDTLAVTNRIMVAQPASTIRAYALYVRANKTVELTRLSPVLTCSVQQMPDTVLRTDALLLRSMWLSHRYLNFFVSLPTGPAMRSHYLGIVDKGLSENGAHTQTLNLQLFHYQNGDGKAYYRDTYFSCRLDSYLPRLSKGDSIRLFYRDEKGRQTSITQAY